MAHARLALKTLLRPSILRTSVRWDHNEPSVFVMPPSPRRPTDPVPQEELPPELRNVSQPFPKWTGYFPDEYHPPEEYALKEKMPQGFKEFPERDIVNYPHYEKKNFPDKVRMGVIPDKWFLPFYDKTGVTGPYLFYGGVVYFLVSKEILVLDNNGSLILPLCFAWATVNKLVGPYLKTYYDDRKENIIRADKAFISMDKKQHEVMVEEEELCQKQYPAIMESLYPAKKEWVALQLEAAFRDRIQTIHQEVKRRLDYLLEVESVKKRYEDRHMVNWIIDQVRQNITPQLEQAALQQCVLDLKTLAKTA